MKPPTWSQRLIKRCLNRSAWIGLDVNHLLRSSLCDRVKSEDDLPCLYLYAVSSCQNILPAIWIFEPLEGQTVRRGSHCRSSLPHLLLSRSSFVSENGVCKANQEDGLGASGARCATTCSGKIMRSPFRCMER